MTVKKIIFINNTFAECLGASVLASDITKMAKQHILQMQLDLQHSSPKQDFVVPFLSAHRRYSLFKTTSMNIYNLIQNHDPFAEERYLTENYDIVKDVDNKYQVRIRFL